jgi:hypothetical protein
VTPEFLLAPCALSVVLHDHPQRQKSLVRKCYRECLSTARTNDESPRYDSKSSLESSLVKFLMRREKTPLVTLLIEFFDVVDTAEVQKM